MTGVSLQLSGLSAPLAGLSGVSYPMDKTATASWKPAVEARIAAQFAAEERTSQADLPRVKVGPTFFLTCLQWKLYLL